MKNCLRIALLAGAIALFFSILAVSCKKDDTILYNFTTTGNVVDGQFISDDGDLFIVTDRTCTGSFEGMERAMISCDILRKNGPNSYDIRLNGIVRMLVKDAVQASTADESAIGNDPISLETGWFSGGYMNIHGLITYKKDSETMHFINLVYDDINSGADTLRFTLRHNGYGEIYGAPEMKNDELALGRVCASFPLEKYIPAGVESIPVKVSWTWYKTNDEGQLITDTETWSIKGILSTRP